MTHQGIDRDGSGYAGGMWMLLESYGTIAAAVVDPSLLLDGVQGAFGGGGSDSGGGGGGGGGFDSGGSSDSGSGGGELPGWAGLLIVGGVLGLVVMGLRSERTAARQRREREVSLWDRLAEVLPGATEATVEAQVRAAIVSLNAAWSAGDTEAMRDILTPRFHAKIAAVLEAMAALGRRNEVGKVVPQEIELVNVDAPGHRAPGSFRCDITYQAADRLLAADGTVLATNASLVRETWKFVLDGERWRLDSVEPATQSGDFTLASIARFAEEHGLHYSADFGRMLLPDRGVLFSDASLEKSDVNNHVVGHLRGRLVQLYTYVAEPVGDPDRQIAVAQATLPRRFNDILVRRRDRRSPLSSGSGELREHSFESMAFNEQWRVLAHADDDVATFELLHPAFLERLANLPHAIGIEAVDHFLYVFDEAGSAPYELMLELLEEAFDELRL